MGPAQHEETWSVYRAVTRQLMEEANQLVEKTSREGRIRLLGITYELIVGWEAVQPGLGEVARQAWVRLYYEKNFTNFMSERQR